RHALSPARRLRTRVSSKQAAITGRPSGCPAPLIEGAIVIHLLRRLLPPALALLLASAVGLIPTPASAADPEVSATVGADCPLSRLQLTLDNRSAQPQTFTVTWPGRAGSPWTRTVAAGDSTLLYWTVPAGTPYTLRVTTPTGYDITRSGLFHCGSGMSALVGFDCTDSRLQLILE